MADSTLDPQSTREQRNKKVLKTWDVEVFNHHNLDFMDELHSPDYVDYNKYPGQPSGLEGFKTLMKEFIAAYPDMRSAPDPVIAEEDFVVCPSFFIGTNTAPFMGIEATNLEVISRRVEVLRFSGEGQILERWGTGNTLEKLQQVGVLPRTVDHGKAIEEAPLKVGQRFIDRVLNQKDLSALTDYVDRRARCDTKGALMLLQMATAFPDASFDVGETMVTEGRKVASFDVNFRGTHQGTFMGIKATERTVDARMSVSLRFANGRIVEMWFDGAEEALRKQLL